MTTPAANLGICAKALESLEKVTNTFSGKMDKLITAIGNIKISGGGGGGKKGGGGGGGGSGGMDVVEAKIYAKAQLALAKKVADEGFASAKKKADLAMQKAKLISSQQQHLNKKDQDILLQKADEYGKAQHYIAWKASERAINDAERLGRKKLQDAGAGAKVERLYMESISKAGISIRKSWDSIDLANASEIYSTKLKFNEKIRKDAVKAAEEKIAADAKIEKKRLKGIEDINAKTYSDEVSKAKAIGDHAISSAKRVADLEFDRAGIKSREALANAKIEANERSDLDSAVRNRIISNAKAVAEANYKLAKKNSDLALSSALATANTALVNAKATSEDQAKLDEKIQKSRIANDVALQNASLANYEAVSNVRRNLNAKINKEETDAKVRSEKASADALKGIKKANEDAAAKKIKDSSNFGGAKNFDIKAFLDSLKGGLLSGVVGAATQGFAVFQKSRQNVSNATGGKGAAGGAAAAAIGPIVGVMGGVTAAMGALTGGFSILIEMVGKFVGALDPAMMEQLNLAFSDLSAVIGIGLRPIISAAVVIVRSFADALVPVMRKLEPVITKLASVLISMAIPLIVQWANQIEQSIPFLEGLVPILAIFGELFNGVLMLVIPLFKILAGVCLILVGVFNTLLVGIHMFNAGVMRVIASILSFIPGNKAKAEAAGRQADQMDKTVQDTSDRAAKNFSDGANMIATASSSTAAELKGGSHGAAAKGASYTGVADLGKNMMQAAFGSSSSTVEDKQLKQQEQATGELSIIRGWLQNTFMKPKDPAQGVRK